MNHDSAKHVQIAHPLGLVLPYGPSFGYCAIPPNTQALQQAKLPAFLLENSLQLNCISKENFVNIPNFPRLSKENSQSIPSTTDWADGEDLLLPDGYQLGKAVEKAEMLKMKSPMHLDEYHMNKTLDLKYLNGVTNSSHSELMRVLGSGLSQNSKKISKYPIGLTSYEARKQTIPLDFQKTVSREYRERQSSKHRNKRNPWKPSEDAKLLDLVRTYGECWAMISSKMGDRTGKQIRDRYLNILRPNLKKGEWTQPEDELLVNLYFQIGHKWSLIAKYMPGRSEAQVKNRFYSHIKKRLHEKPGEFKIPSLSAQDIFNKSLEYGDMEMEDNEGSTREEEDSEEDDLSNNLKAEDHEGRDIKVEFSQTGSEAEFAQPDVKQEKEEDIGNCQKMPAKLWDPREVQRWENQKRYAKYHDRELHEEFSKSHKGGGYGLNTQPIRTNPINEKEVDMVLEILARYYQDGKQVQSQESQQRERLIKQIQQQDTETGAEKETRLRQLDIRKAQLEFLLGQTLREMENIQQKEK